jgi:hypothetical protein
MCVEFHTTLNRLSLLVRIMVAGNPHTLALVRVPTETLRRSNAVMRVKP